MTIEVQYFNAEGMVTKPAIARFVRVGDAEALANQVTQLLDAMRTQNDLIARLKAEILDARRNGRVPEAVWL